MKSSHFLEDSRVFVDLASLHHRRADSEHLHDFLYHLQRDSLEELAASSSCLGRRRPACLKKLEETLEATEDTEVVDEVQDRCRYVLVSLHVLVEVLMQLQSFVVQLCGGGAGGGCMIIHCEREDCFYPKELGASWLVVTTTEER